MSDAPARPSASPEVASPRSETVVRREMGCTLEEFLGWLPGATRHAPARIEAGTATVHARGGTVHISFRQLPPRTIGLVSIPVLEVAFGFTGMDAASRDEFLAYFDLYTNRGGG
jgi:hypothetical protein